MATYSLAYTTSPASVLYDGVALTEYGSLAAAIAAGRGWFDDVAGASTLYVVLDGGDTPDNGTITAVFETPVDDFYEPRIKSLPNLSLRIEPDFSDVGQVGGGVVKLENVDGYFNELRRLRWAAGTTTIRMGCDTAHETMAAGDYETIAVFENGDPEFDEEFGLRLVERKHKLRKTIPAETFDLTTYPFIQSKWRGKPIPVAYGQIYQAPAIPSNTNTKAFLLAGHAIYSLGTVEYLDTATNVWTPASVTADLAGGGFTFASWDGVADVRADFVGRKNDDGTAMINGAHVVEDLLAQAGETNLDAASFTAAAAAIAIGTDFQTGAPVVSRPVSLYLGSRTSAEEAIKRVNAFVGSYLYAGADGTYYYRVFEPVPVAGLEQLTSAEILSLKIEEDTKGIVSKVIGLYGHRHVGDWDEVITEENTGTQYAQGESSALPVTIEIPTSDDDAAQAAVERELVMKGEPLRLYRIEAPWRYSTLQPGDQVWVEYSGDGHEIAAVLEVLERTLDLGTATVIVTLGDLHGFLSTGFWAADAPTFPSELGGATVTAWDANWTAAQKNYARYTWAFWTDDNGFADPSDPDSYQPSRFF